jgi:CubicO group peptidase (beta-lactamase class C family)
MNKPRVTARQNRSERIGGTAILGCALLTFTLVAISATSNLSAQQNQQMSPLEIAREIDSAFSGIVTPGDPGFALLVKKDGQIVFEKGYGVRDLRSKTKIDAKTNFRLASFTKQFTAMAIMLLVHDGKLRYDETLTDIFSEFPAYGKNITVRNLLNHTGGLADYEDLMDAVEKSKGPRWSAEKQISDAEVLQLLEKESHGKFVPGTKWEYSNSGYVVLGLVVTKRSGRPFAEFLHDRIFVPLKMERTLVFEKGKNKVANRAYGHSKKENVFVETDQSSTSATQGDGGIYSNLEDLSKWDDALRNHTLLSEKEFLPAITPAKLPPGAESKLADDVPPSLRGKANAYGFGWFLNLQDAHPLMWHYGETMGFKTAIVRYVHDNVTVIPLCNRTDLDQGALALKAAEPLLARK